MIEAIGREKLLQRSVELGERMRSRLAAMARRNDLVPIAAIRGLGAMVAFDIVKERGTFAPDPDTTKRVTVRALDRGLVVLACGVYGNVIRILVPLTASDAIVDEGLDVLESALRAA